jgi:hypothetical protein
MHPVPQAKTALKAILAARGAWAAVDIRDGQPTEGEDVTRDAFWFEPTEIPQDAWIAGGLTRAVTFRLGFTIALIRDSDDERATEDLAWTLFEDLMTALKTDASIGGTVLTVDDVTGRQINQPMPNQWRAVFTGAITCRSKFY